MGKGGQSARPKALANVELSILNCELDPVVLMEIFLLTDQGLSITHLPFSIFTITRESVANPL